MIKCTICGKEAGYTRTLEHDSSIYTGWALITAFRCKEHIKDRREDV